MKKLLIENIIVSPDDWKKEIVTTDTGIKESIVLPQFDTFEQELLDSKDECLIETWKSQKDSILQELLSKSSRLRVTGPAQQEDTRNGNGRIYPRELWDRVLGEDSPFMNRLKNRYVLGELEHPDSGNTKLHGHNHLGLSHMIESVERKNGVIYATHLIFNTPAGKILREYFDNGISVCVSSRGSGSTRVKDDVEIVEASDYLLDTWDFVYLPSVSIARTRPVESIDDNSSKSKTTVLYVPNICNKPKTESKRMSKNILKESSDRLAKCRLVLASSGTYLSEGKKTLDDLLNHNTAVSEALASLGTVTEEDFSSDVADLRGSLTIRSEEINRTIKRVREEEDEEKEKNDIELSLEEPPKKKDDEKEETLARILRKAIKSVREEDEEDKEDNEEEVVDKEESLARVIRRVLFKEEDECDDTKKKDDDEEEKKENLIVKVIEELVRRLKRTESQLHKIRPKYEYSKELGDALVVRARSDRKNLETLLKRERKSHMETNNKLEAAITLLEATIKRYRKEDVSRYVRDLVHKHPRLKKIESKLAACTTRNAAKNLVESVVAPLLENSGSYPSDLPPIGNQRRSVPTQMRPKMSSNLMENLVETERRR